VKFIIDNWMLFSIAIASGFLLLLPIIQSGMTTGISTSEAVLMMNREKAVVIDLSEPAEFAQGHPVGAVNLSLNDLGSSLNKLVTDKSRPLIFFCQNGGVSAKGVAQAQKLGFTKVHLIGGGLKSWREANLPLQKA
jgi:rhodanese-related sulfurtransferase